MSSQDPNDPSDPNPEDPSPSPEDAERAEAEAYFNSFSPEDQAAIRASWGGRDLLLEWYRNAKSAGSVPKTPPPGGPGGPGSPKFTGPGGFPTPTELRAWSRSQGWSEDFERFSDAVLQDWITRFWNPANNMFRQEHWQERPDDPDFQGGFEKPVDLPPGWEAWGDGYRKTGDPGDPDKPPDKPPEKDQGASWLQEYLMALFGQQGGAWAPGSGVEGAYSGYAAHPLKEGGVLWSPTDQNGPNKPGTCPDGMFMWPDKSCRKEAPPKKESAPNSAPDPTRGAAALTSATLNAFGPQAPSATMGSPTAQALSPPTVPTPTAPRPAAPAAPGSNFLPPAAPLSPLAAQVNRRYNPVQNQWWAPR